MRITADIVVRGGALALASAVLLLLATTACGGDSGGGQSTPGATTTAGAAMPDAEASAAVISAGSAACAVEDGSLHCWGMAGAPAGVDFGGGVTAVSARGATLCVVKDAAAWCAGANDKGQLGNGAGTASDAPVAVTGMASGVTAVSAGSASTCAIKDGGAWCWGASEKGQLGDGTTTSSLVPVAVTGMEDHVTAISAGTNHTCAIKDGGAWCWGMNFFGQLGSGDFTDSVVAVAVPGMESGVTAISAGANATCAVKNGAAWCWGNNFNGALGIARTETCGGDPCSSSPLIVQGMDRGVTAIDTDGNYTCAIKDGAAWCWGHAHGIPRTQVRAPSVVRGMEEGVEAIAVSSLQFSCGLIAGEAWCWGVNERGELGDGTTNDSVDIAVKVTATAPAEVVASPTVAATPAPPQAIATPPAPPANDADALRAAIRQHSPGIGFDPECSATNPAGPCATGSWPAAMLASGIAGVSIHGADSGIATWFGRRADGTWVHWFATQNSGGPQVSLPGEMIVCADGDGLNLRAEPSTSGAVITLLPDGTVVRGDSFVMTDPPTAGSGGMVHPDGWYHIVSPQGGWAYDRFLLARGNGVTACVDTWWP